MKRPSEAQDEEISVKTESPSIDYLGTESAVVKVEDLAIKNEIICDLSFDEGKDIEVKNSPIAETSHWENAEAGPSLKNPNAASVRDTSCQHSSPSNAATQAKRLSACNPATGTRARNRRETLQEMLDWLDEDEEMIAITAAMFAVQHHGSREQWVRPLNEKRREFGQFHTLWPEISRDDERCKKYIRMTKKEFDVILNLLQDKLRKKNTHFREAISAEERLLLTLRYLSTGKTYRSLGIKFRVGFTTVGGIVRECCEALYKTLQPIYMPQPDQNAWRQISLQLEKNYNLPHCVGVLQGKNVQIQCPNNASSPYKGIHSMVILALVDANYKFTYVDVGNYGCNDDVCVFDRSELGQSFVDNKINFPPDDPLTPNGPPCPFVVAGDQSFPLKRNLMRPFGKNTGGEPECIFNSRLENVGEIGVIAIGMLTTQWRIFNKPIETRPEIANNVIMAVCCLHNFLRDSTCGSVEPDVDSVDALTPLGFAGEIYARDALEVREMFRDFFSSSAGSVVEEGFYLWGDM